MSMLIPQTWHLPCVKCRRNSVTVSGSWDDEEVVFHYSSQSVGSYVRHLGRNDGDDMFLVICSRCAEQVYENPDVQATPLYCSKCSKPFLLLFNSEDNSWEIFGGEASVMTIAGQSLKGKQICTSCSVRSHL